MPRPADRLAVCNRCRFAQPLYKLWWLGAESYLCRDWQTCCFNTAKLRRETPEGHSS